MKSASTALVVFALVVLSGCAHRHPHGLYSDAEAAAMAKRAEGLIPNGTTKTKREVFAVLGLDPRRLAEHRITGRVMNVYFERGRLSHGYGIEWMMAAQDATPHKSLNRKIYGLHIGATEPR